MIKVLFAFFTTILLSSCYVGSYDPYYASAPFSIYSGYGYTRSYGNYYSQPYTIYTDNYRLRYYTPSYNRCYRNRH